MFGPPALPVVLDSDEDDDDGDDNVHDDDTEEDDTLVSIDINYLRPNMTQKRTEAKLLCPLGQLNPHMRKQERRRGSEVLDTTVDLDAIFTPPSRKRKFSSEPNSKVKRRKYNFYFC